MFGHLNLLDKEHSTIVFDAIANDRIVCAVQEIRSTVAPHQIVYGECLARLIGPDGYVYAANEFVPYLETVGETPVIDRHMVKLVLDLLEADTTKVLGINLSAENLANTKRWNAIRDQILDRVYLAPRLVLELTEVQELSGFSFGAGAIAELQSLGCRVALDDFGTDFASPGLFEMVNFDVIKIDATFVLDMRPFHDGFNSLCDAVGLASRLAPLIIAAVAVSGTARYFPMP